MRQHPLPHPPIPTITATPADSPVLDIGLVLSLDTFGDVQPPTYSKCRYWLACTDLGGSRFIHLHLLKSRKPSHYIEKLSLIFDDYTLHGHTVRTIRADREFAVPEELKQFFIKRKIHLQLSAPHEHGQNGAAERLQQTLSRRVTANMLNYPDIPDKCWGFCAVDAVHKLNLRPHPTHPSKTIYEVFTGTRVDWTTLLPFGLPCYGIIPFPMRQSKFSPKAFEGIIVGTDIQTNNGVIIFNPQTKRSVTRRSFTPCAPATIQPLHQLHPPQEENILLDDTDDDIHQLVDVPTGTESDESESGSYSDSDSGDDSLDSSSQSELDPDPPPDQPLRRSTRARNHLFALTTITVPATEPRSLTEAQQRPDWPMWDQALQDEINSLWDRGTFELVQSIPSGHRPIPSKFTFKLALNPDNTVRKYKIRIVCRGDKQTWTTYSETFAGTASRKTVMLLFALAVHLNLPVHTIDVKSAFLYPTLDEEIYLQLPVEHWQGQPRLSPPSKGPLRPQTGCQLLHEAPDLHLHLPSLHTQPQRSLHIRQG